jgi:hypothetical protein
VKSHGFVSINGSLAQLEFNDISGIPKSVPVETSEAEIKKSKKPKKEKKSSSKEKKLKRRHSQVDSSETIDPEAARKSDTEAPTIVDMEKTKKKKSGTEKEAKKRKKE